MVAAVELYFDHPAERRFRQLWAAMAGAGVPNLGAHTHGRHRPHLSLAVAPALRPDAVRSALDGLPAAPPLTLSFQFTGLFVGRVLWLGPAPSAALIAHQAAVWSRLTGAGIPIDERYRPDAWVPHATLSMRVPRPQLLDALRLCLEVLPIEATCTAAAVADHNRGVLAPL